MVPLFWIIATTLVWKSFPVDGNEKFETDVSWIAGMGNALIVLLVAVLFIRNSFGQKPLLPGNAFVLQPHAAGHAALNTGFVLLKTLESFQLEKASFLSEAQVNEVLKTPSGNSAHQLPGYNLVIVILESFATEYTGLKPGAAAQTPFLDSLAKSSLYFPHHFACGRTSRDALPSILASVPSWMDESFAGSAYVSVGLEGLGATLKKAGYETAFFHGGKNGTMSFDLVSRICGFQHYYGLNEYPDFADFDGNWGIFDKPFLQYSIKEINQLKQPFAACIFTLSSHQPYTLPAGWADTLGTRGQPVFKAVRYADDALRHYFKAASTQSWYSNTLFVLTADHTHHNFSPAFQNHQGLFDVPLLFYSPGKKIEADTGRYLQHSDIRPTILDLLGCHGDMENSLGRSVFAPAPLWPMQYQDGNYYVVHSNGLLAWDGLNANRGWKWNGINGNPEPEGLRLQTISRLQYFRNGLLDNRLFRKSGKKVPLIKKK
jgi:uncharacterized sulfatase